MKKFLWLLPYLLTGLIAGIVSGVIVSSNIPEPKKVEPVIIKMYENELSSLDKRIDSIGRAVLPDDSAAVRYLQNRYK